MDEPTSPRDLARMKRIALALLGAAAVLYVAATLLEPRHVAWGYVAAFGEAAMVGAVADWFAVVALFRHPLGLPIPHTAVIPAGKRRIGRSLADFLCAHFLSTEQVLEKLGRFGAGNRLADCLADPHHAEQLSKHAGAALRYGLASFDDERVRRFVGTTLLALLARLDLGRTLSQLLGVATSGARHHAVLELLLRRLAALLGDAQITQRMAEIIAGEVKLLKLVGLDELAGRYAAAKVVAGMTRLLAEMACDPSHPLRGRFDEYLADLAQRLQADAALRERVEEAKHALLGHAPFATWLQGLWSSLLAALLRDLDADERASPCATGEGQGPACDTEGRRGSGSLLRAQLASAAVALGRQLQGDAAMRGWIDAQVLAAAPRWIDSYRERIRQYVVARVESWDAAEMTDELERSIGRDLQFIRINGTLVGGLVGLAIHAATELFKA